MTDDHESTVLQVVAAGPSASGQKSISDTVQTPIEASPMRSKFRLWSIVLALDTVLFVAALDQTVVATAIPTITKTLNSATGYTRIDAAYLIASAVAGPLWTKTSDIWGRKLALLSSVFIFAVASMIAALAIDMPMLIAARALQGCACGGIFQLVSVTTSDLFSLRDRSFYFGLQGGVYAIAGSAGPLIGGACSQYLTWRWCFWINLPCCGLSFILLSLFLDVHNPRTALLAGLKALDWAGTASLLAMSLMFLLGLEFGGSIYPWSSPAIICLVVVGAFMVLVFVYSEKKIATYPLLPLKIFAQPSTNAIFVLAISHSMISIGVEYYLPLYLQSVKQQSPFFSGLILLPWMITAAATDVVSGMIIHRTSSYMVQLRIGVCLMTIGTGLYISMSGSTSIPQVIGYEIVNAAGIALLFQIPILVLHSTVKQNEVASASSALGFMKTLGTATSIVIGGAIFQNSMDNQKAPLTMAGLDQSTLTSFSGENAAASIDVIGTIVDSLQKGTVINAYSWSIRNIFIFYTCLAGLTIVASVFARQGHMSEEHTETKTGIEHLSRRKDNS